MLRRLWLCSGWRSSRPRPPPLLVVALVLGAIPVNGGMLTAGNLDFRLLALMTSTMIRTVSGSTGTIIDGRTWITGGGSSSPWSVTGHSSLVSYCATYDLCTLWYVFDGSTSDPTGKSIDFAGPNYASGPWTFTIDMGSSETFAHWRVAGQTWYSMGSVELRYENAAGQMESVGGSSMEWDSSVGGLQSAAFTAPITASVWQVYITSHSNSDYQSRFQLCECCLKHYRPRSLPAMSSTAAAA